MEAIRIDPNYVNPFIGRGMSRGEKCEYDKALVASEDLYLSISAVGYPFFT